VNDRPTVIFFPEGAHGPTNNCVGIGQELLRRGARVVFIIEESFRGTLEPKGFEEQLMRLTPPPETEEAPGQFWTDFIRETAPVFRESTLEQFADFMQPTWQALIDGSKYVDARLEEIFDEVRPDVVVEDNVVTFPAVLRQPAPWVRIVSCNPLEIPDPDLPPPYAGLPAGDRSEWDRYREEYERTHAEMHADFDAFCRERGCPPLPELEFIHTSEHLNLYLYPEAADYPRSAPLPEVWARIESCVRDPEEEAPELPDHIREGEGALAYLSLGSLGSADTELMRRLIDVLGSTDHRFIVSMGPLHEQLELAENMWGMEFLPQAALLPHVDLVLTHGGNNTVTECFHHGKPMVVLPIFWDQHDNAQRVDELELGVRIDTYHFEERELVGAVDRLAADEPLRDRVRQISEGIKARAGRDRAATLIERVGRGAGADGAPSRERPRMDHTPVSGGERHEAH
jgi:MGT family glycosyltransferase